MHACDGDSALDQRSYRGSGTRSFSFQGRCRLTSDLRPSRLPHPSVASVSELRGLCVKKGSMPYALITFGFGVAELGSLCRKDRTENSNFDARIPSGLHLMRRTT
jgi:hypothetical protein